MHAVIRNYSGDGAQKLCDALEEQKAGVEKAIKDINGFVSYLLVRTDEGAFSVSVFQDKAGVDESVQVARTYISQDPELANLAVPAPTVIEGRVIIKANGSKQVLMHFRTADFNHWKEAFESHKERRKELSGVTSEIVYQSASDPNQALCIFEVEDINRAIESTKSEEVRGYMEQSGIIGTPQINILA